MNTNVSRDNWLIGSSFGPGPEGVMMLYWNPEPPPAGHGWTLQIHGTSCSI